VPEPLWKDVSVYKQGFLLNTSNSIKSTLHITGTSFLLPNNRAWSPLQAEWQTRFSDYGAWGDTLTQAAPDEAVIVFFLLNDTLPPYGITVPEGQERLQLLLDLLKQRLSLAEGPTLIATALHEPLSPVARARQAPIRAQLLSWLNDRLYSIAQQHPHLYVLDLDREFCRRRCPVPYDARNWYLAHCRLSAGGLSVAAQAVCEILHRHTHPAAKVLVLDCDNTLWGGVIGEDGFEGLILGSDGVGQAYQDFQRCAKALSSIGVLLCLASKNNENDVWNVFDNHASMVLRRDDIVTSGINWRDKASNIEQIAHDLSLGLDSFVFWDDNPAERAQVQARLPSVLVPDIPAEVTQWPDLLMGMTAFARFAVTSEDTRKITQYKERQAFLTAQRQSSGEKDFLKSIDLQPSLVPLEASTVMRAEQLCAKTNQFNLRTQRHSAAALKKLHSHCEDGVFLAGLRDKFGDHGIVGLAVCVPYGNVAFLDTFLLSCRVIGRHLEAWMLAQLKERLIKQGYEWLVAGFRPTEKNQVAEGVLEEHGLMELTPNESARLLDPAAFNAPPASEERLFSVRLADWHIPHLELFE